MRRVLASCLIASLAGAPVAPPASGESPPAPVEPEHPVEAEAAPEPEPGAAPVELEPTPTPAPPEAPPAVAPVAEGPEPAPTTVPTATPKGKLGCRGSKSCFNLTITGTVLGSLSLASIGVGAALLALPDEPIGDDPAYVTSTKPPGLVATTLGVGVLLTSILMIVAAQRGARTEASEAPRGRAALRPSRGPT